MPTGIFILILVIFVPFLLLILAFFGFIAKLIFKSKNESWTGTVISKGHNTKRGDSNRLEHFYFMTVKMDDDTRDRNIGLSQVMLDTFEVGDKIKKEKGQLFPEKI